MSPRSLGRDVRRAAALGKAPRCESLGPPCFIETASSQGTGEYGLLRSSFSSELVIRRKWLSHIRKLALLQSAQHRVLGLDGIEFEVMR